MANRPIIFSTPMVRALLAGKKTQTRRLARSKREPSTSNQIQYSRRWDGSSVWRKVRPGDRLWVREAFAEEGATGTTIVAGQEVEMDADWYVYRADLTPDQEREAARINRICSGLKKIARPWRPSIHMPREASRLTLVVTDVAEHNIQDIHASQCVEEGIDPTPHLCGCEICRTQAARCPATNSGIIMAFAELWRSIHGPEAWDDNPVVVAMSFTVHRCNIDHMEQSDDGLADAGRDCSAH